MREISSSCSLAPSASSLFYSRGVEGGSNERRNSTIRRRVQKRGSGQDRPSDRQADGQMDVRKGRTVGVTDARTYGKTYEWKD